jgi:hypothetical protein
LNLKQIINGIQSRIWSCRGPAGITDASAEMGALVGDLVVVNCDMVFGKGVFFGSI